MPTVVVQQWEESEHEPGWGTTIRDDGYSIHLTMNSCQKFRDEFWKQQRTELGVQTPPFYTRESGEPIAVEVSPRQLEAITAALGTQQGVWGTETSFNGVPTPRSES